MKNILVITILLSLVGCASQIMKSYIGKDIREVMLDYGSPSNAGMSPEPHFERG